MARSPRERRREERIVRRDQLALLGRVMSEPSGRDYFWNLLASTHMFESSFAVDASVMAFFEGERNIGLQIQNDLMQANPDAFITMLKERGNVRPPDPDRDDLDTDDAGWTDSDNYHGAN